MASPFLNSPTEILHMILEPLARADLSALCLACNRLRAIAEPLLYSNIQWTWTWTWTRTRTMKDKPPTPPIVPLLQSIMHRPELADFIQNVHLSGTDFEPSPSYHKHPNLLLQVTVADVERMVQCVQDTNVPYGNLWIDGLTSGNTDAFVALLLSELPNVRYLHIEPKFIRKSHLMGMVLRSALCEEERGGSPFRTRFERLRKVHAANAQMGLDV